MGKVLILVLIGFFIFILVGGLNMIIDILVPGATPDYELPKIKRELVYAPDEEIGSLTEAYADAGLELPQGVSFIDYDSDDYILSLGRYENAEDRPIRSTVYFFNGEEQSSGVEVYFAVTDRGAASAEAEHGGSVRAGNVVCYISEERPATKTALFEEAAVSVHETTFYNRVYVSWSKRNSPENADIPGTGGFAAVIMGLQERFGGVGAPLAILLLALILLYFTFFKWYRRKLLAAYGLDVFGWPAKFTVFCYFLVMLLASFGVINDPLSTGGGSDMQSVLSLLLIGAPGMIWQTLLCFAHTRSLLLAVFNLALMYIVCFFMGYLAVVVIIIFVILKIFGHMFKESLAPSKVATCSNCGAKLALGENTCPNCGATLI